MNQNLRIYHWNRQMIVADSHEEFARKLWHGAKAFQVCSTLEDYIKAFCRRAAAFGLENIPSDSPDSFVEGLIRAGLVTIDNIN